MLNATMNSARLIAATAAPRTPYASTLPAMISAELIGLIRNSSSTPLVRSRTSDIADECHGQVLENQREDRGTEERDDAWRRAARC